LGAVGFESFVETENGLVAYIQKDDYKTCSFSRES
jgi:hypothetical protein